MTPRAEEAPDGFVRPLYTLYTPGQVGLATFLGAPLAGSWLLARNFKKLGKPGLGWLMLVMGLVWTAGLCTLGILERVPGIVSVLSIPAMVLVMRGAQGRALDHHTSVGGAQTSWGYVVGAGFACLAIVFAAVFGIAVAYTLATTPPSVSAPHGAEVRYTDGATEADAIRVRDALNEIEYFRDAYTVQVSRDTRWVVSYVVTDEGIRDRDTARQFGDLAEHLSLKAFDHQPVDTVVMNDMSEPVVRIAFEQRLRALTFDGKDELEFRNVTVEQATAIGNALQGFFGQETGHVATLDRDRIALAITHPPTEVQGLKYQRMARAVGEVLGTMVELALERDGVVSKTYRWSELIAAPVMIADGTPVFYRDGATLEQAQQVAEAIDEWSPSMDLVIVTTDDNYQPARLVVGVYLLEEVAASPETLASLRKLAAPVSKRMAGAPVDVRVLDRALTAIHVLSWEDRAKRPGKR